MRHVLLAAVALVLVAACSSSAPTTFALESASVDPTYYCPGGANNAAYDLHATLNVRNGTSKAVTIDAVTAQMTVASVKGPWIEKVGERYNADGVTFAPATVAAGRSSSVKLTIPSACTSGKYGTGTSSSADYNVSVHLMTSAGTFAITAANQHEIVAD
ncbi:MAG TPA: hypothetical protein VGX22_12275 [Candidatus Dormibacteraeota bacterium]|nr:hypothetical protein [Candidatus Dormibacteraeota bacterium]